MRVYVVFKAITRNWLHSRSGLFFSFLFPVVFLLIFGSVFGGSSSSLPLTVQNNDVVAGAPTPVSVSFIVALNSTRVLSVSMLPAGSNVTKYVEDQASSFGGDPRVLVIPSGFAADIAAQEPVNLTYTSSPSDQLAGQVEGVVSEVANSFNFQLAQKQPLVGLASVSASVRPLNEVDYYMPGLIAAFMMTNGVIGLTNVATEFKRTGLTKRLSATPLTKLEWILGNVLSQTVLAMALAAVMIVLGAALFHTSVTVDGYTVAILVSGAIMFSGIGMALAGLVKDPEAAAGVGNAIAFPMMFLSGTFWPLSIMPGFLQAVARVLPLTYFSEGLRDSMVVGNAHAALLNLAATTIFAVAFIAIGAWATRWQEG
jgi:ABC-2 type transport system permease protein